MEVPVPVQSAGRKESQPRKSKQARHKFAKNVNQGSKGLIKMSKKTMSKLNPVQTLLRAKGKEESGFGQSGVRSVRSKKSRGGNR